MTLRRPSIIFSLVLTFAAAAFSGCAAQKTATTFPNGAVYTGSVNRAGSPDGRGIATYPDGRRYDGQWKNGQWHGDGKLTLADGSTHEGEFRDGKAHGKGVFTRPDGARDEGTWANGDCDGVIVHTTPLGTKMNSEYREGQLVRTTGTTIYKEGTVQTGEWDGSTGLGKGTIEWIHGQRYDGEWRSVRGDVDQPHGQGRMTYAHGRNYVGSFQDGRFHGQGKLTFDDGKVQEGQWENGKFVGPAR